MKTVGTKHWAFRAVASSELIYESPLPLLYELEGVPETFASDLGCYFLGFYGHSFRKESTHVGVSPEYEVASQVDCGSNVVFIDVVLFSPAPVALPGAIVGEGGHVGMR
jgi:hypothetical protein